MAMARPRIRRGERMILKGSQRGEALKLAFHLQRLDENNHVDVHELRGFSSGSLRGAGSVTYLCRSFDSIMCSKGDEPWAQAGRMDSAKAEAALPGMLVRLGQPGLVRASAGRTGLAPRAGRPARPRRRGLSRRSLFLEPLDRSKAQRAEREARRSGRLAGCCVRISPSRWACAGNPRREPTRRR